MRKECMNCEQPIKQIGDPFCVKCEPRYRLDDDGFVRRLYKNMYINKNGEWKKRKKRTKVFQK